MTCFPRGLSKSYKGRVKMIVEIVSTGTELLLGQIINTNAPFLARQLNALGFDVLYQSTVGDNKERMAAVIQTALSRADIVITSGGLGPTLGDITKEVTADILGKTLVLHEPSLARIQCFFAHRNADMPHNNTKQALLPEGAKILKNERGTAPGVVIEHHDKTIIHLPGPPHELEWMFQQSVAPYLKERFGTQGVIVSKTLHTYGIGESAVAEMINDYIISQTNPTIALLAKKEGIQIRITAKAVTEDQAYTLIAGLEDHIRQRIAEYIYATDSDTMEAVVGSLLTDRHLTISLAESCTGGLTTSRLTDIPGSSNYLVGSVVCYSNIVKIREVHVPENVLAEYGAVSKRTAEAMAAGIRNKFNSTIGVGITGIAGPGGATPNKPVGLVYIGIDGPTGLQCHKYIFNGERVDIKYRTSQAALDIVRRYCSKV
jgi:nicotinamide-nucleotide amidase